MDTFAKQPCCFVPAHTDTERQQQWESLCSASTPNETPQSHKALAGFDALGQLQRPKPAGWRSQPPPPTPVGLSGCSAPPVPLLGGVSHQPAWVRSWRWGAAPLHLIYAPPQRCLSPAAKGGGRSLLPWGPGPFPPLQAPWGPSPWLRPGATWDPSHQQHPP